MKLLCLFLCVVSIGGAATDILLLGDSWINGRARLAYPLAAHFQADLGLAGAGYCSLVDSNGSADSGMVFYYGNSGWSVKKNSSLAIGPDATDVTGTTIGQELRFLLRSQVDEIEFYYLAQPGGGIFEVYSGNEALVTVNTESDESAIEVHRLDWSSPPGASEIQIFVSDPAEAGVRLAGLNFIARDGEVRVHEMGTGGASSATFVRLNRDSWIEFVRQLRPEVVCILLGTNDHAYNHVPATFKANIEELVDRVHEARPNAEVLLLSPGDNGLTERTYAIEDYREVLSDIAVEKGFGFVDLFAQLGSYEDAVDEGLYDDLVHPSSAGGLLLRDAVLSVLKVGPNRELDVVRLWDRNEVLRRAQLHCASDGNGATLSWLKFPGVNYTLKESYDLHRWTPLTIESVRGEDRVSLFRSASTKGFWSLDISSPLLRDR